MSDLATESLKSQLDIVDVIGQYVRLKKQGAGERFVGLCPFHSEKTPSFGVNSARQYYKCFGCDAAGDVFDFVQQIEGVSFLEAKKRLAEQAGITLVRSRSNYPRIAEADRTQAELFRVGFCWQCERYLEALKELWALDEEAVPPPAIRNFTCLLERVRSYSTGRLVEFKRKLQRSRPCFVSECIAEVEQAHRMIAALVNNVARIQEAA